MITIRPRRLSQGDLIGIYSPSSAVTATEMEAYQRGRDLLHSYGYGTIEATHTFAWEGHYSASGEKKASDLHELVKNPEIKAIFPTIGGNTVNHMLPYIDFSLLKDNPKLFVGFSDSSLLINVITDRTGIVTLHGHCDIVFGLGDLRGHNPNLQAGGRYTEQSLFETLSGERGLGKVEPFGVWKSIRSGSTEGVLRGGNLSDLQILHGTPWEPSWDGAILFWEDCVDLHRVDLALMALRHTGILERIAGMVVGRGTQCVETFYTDKIESFEQIVERICGDFEFPIILDADIGHDMECCHLPIGCRAAIDGAELHILEKPLA